MSSRVMAIAALIVASAACAQPALAQYRVHYGFYPGAPPMDPSITAYGGYMYMGHYVDGPLGTSASGADAGLLGAQVTLPLTPNFAVVGNVAHANSALAFYDITPGGSSATNGNTEVWLFDGDIQLSAPVRGYGRHWIDPFFQLGAGAMRYEAQYPTGTTSSTNFAFNVGAGLNYYVSRQVALQIAAKDYIGHWSTPGSAYSYGYYNGGRYTSNPSITAGLLFGL